MAAGRGNRDVDCPAVRWGIGGPIICHRDFQLRLTGHRLGLGKFWLAFNCSLPSSVVVHGDRHNVADIRVRRAEAVTRVLNLVRRHAVIDHKRL